MAGADNNPAKNFVRDALYRGFEAFRATLESAQDAPAPVAIYLPGTENLEAPLLAAAGLDAWGAERDRKTLRQMTREDAAFPPDPSRVFHGTLRDAVLAHAQAGRPRALLVNADFEGKLYADDLLSVFSVFPAREGGLLAVTTLAGRDPISIDDGLLCASALGAAVEQDLWPIIDRSARRWRRYGRRHGDPRDAWHAQVARDMALLWRIALGIGMVEHPLDAPGSVRAKLREGLREEAFRLLRDFERIKHAGNGSRQLPRLSSPVIAWIFEQAYTPIVPHTMARWVTHGRAGKCRMTTWHITFVRATPPVSWRTSTSKLVDLYAASPLVYVDDAGNPQLIT